MALVIDLKPHERIIIGQALITNDTARTRLHIEGQAPILREKDILREEDADTPCKKVYLAVQIMYLSGNPQPLQATYFELVRDIQKAAPSTGFFFLKINELLLNDQYYKALKECRQLVEHERELLASV
jgi:flagellar biosynthesis repressor protein FlbT